MNGFGEHVKRLREERRRTDRSFSLRQVAGRIGVEPSYLSKIEREELPIGRDHAQTGSRTW